ncbi:hypothetical protein EC991_007063 [Linnemannia zychae]|nr:hypothetical protein EC991_007063 [Linnemannia zychae]
MVLELCAGGSVADLIRLSDGSMTESEIGWIMSQVLLGLAYLHSIDHVHGDIKASFSESTPLQGRDRASVLHQYRLLSMPGASTETDVWALGVACIELSQGRPPRPETPILASYGDWRHITTLGNIASATGDVSAPTSQQNGWHLPNDVLETVGMGMSEEMWVFIRKCLAPDPEARPTVQELLQYGTASSVKSFC